MKFLGNYRTAVVKLLLSAAFAATSSVVGAADAKSAQYWLDHPAERAKKLKECIAHAAPKGDSPECIAAGRAATAALGGGKPVYVGVPAVPAAAPPSPSDQACTMEALKAIRDKDAREDMASACIRRGTFKPTPKRVF